MSIEQQIRQYIVENMAGASGVSFADEDSLSEKGVVDSQGIIQIVSFVEERFGVTFADSEITSANCSSIHSFTAFVHARQRKKP